MVSVEGVLKSFRFDRIHSSVINTARAGCQQVSPEQQADVEFKPGDDGFRCGLFGWIKIERCTGCVNRTPPGLVFK